GWARGRRFQPGPRAIASRAITRTRRLEERAAGAQRTECAALHRDRHVVDAVVDHLLDRRRDRLARDEVADAEPGLRVALGEREHRDAAIGDAERRDRYVRGIVAVVLVDLVGEDPQAVLHGELRDRAQLGLVEHRAVGVVRRAQIDAGGAWRD